MTALPLLDLSYQLSDLPDRASYLAAARSELGLLLPGDDTFWMECDFAASTASVWHGSDPDPELGELLGRASDYPTVLSYVSDPSDLRPRRMSDVVDALTWRGGSAYELLGDRVGRHQLSLVVRLDVPQGDGWTVGRSLSDFTDAETELACAVVPLLVALDRVYRRAPAEPGGSGVTPAGATATAGAQADVIDLGRRRFPGNLPSDGTAPGAGPASGWAEEAQVRWRLTGREVDVLTLLSAGLTADAIARVRRISAATVRKHLQNVYAKLGVSDRLMAVEVARRRGILPWPKAAGGL